MKLGMLLFLLIPIIGHVYVFWHVWNIVPLNNWYKAALLVLLSMGVVALIFGFSIGLNIVPFKCATYIYEFGTSSIFVLCVCRDAVSSARFGPIGAPCSKAFFI